MNKNIFFSLSVLSLLLIVIQLGCSKKSNSNPLTPDNQTSAYGSITLNGSGYNNTVVNFTAAMGDYSTSQGMTNCLEYGKLGSDSILVIIAFAGNTTGNYSWEEFTQSSSYINGVAITIYNSAGVTKYFMPKSGGQTSVSKYGAVNQTIEGSYSGTTQDAASTTTITVTGSFKATRLPNE